MSKPTVFHDPGLNRPDEADADAFVGALTPVAVVKVVASDT
jgi:hypothetical protein